MGIEVGYYDFTVSNEVVMSTTFYDMLFQQINYDNRQQIFAAYCRSLDLLGRCFPMSRLK